MIVKHTGQGWEVIFQRAHALLAAQIAMAWKKDQQLAPWTDLVAAIADHDDGQRDWEADNHLTEQGAPMDFRHQGPDLVQAKRIVDNARYRSRWIAYYTSRHTSALYEPWREQGKDIANFLDEQQEYQQKLVKTLNSTRKEADRRYRLMYFCDALSLILCKGEAPPDGCKLEIAPLPDQRMASIFLQDKKILALDPWPFEEDSLSIGVEVFVLPQLSYKSDQKLYEAFDNAEISIREWHFKQA